MLFFVDSRNRILINFKPKSKLFRFSLCCWCHDNPSTNKYYRRNWMGSEAEAGPWGQREWVVLLNQPVHHTSTCHTGTWVMDSDSSFPPGFWTLLLGPSGPVHWILFLLSSSFYPPILIFSVVKGPSFFFVAIYSLWLIY